MLGFSRKEKNAKSIAEQEKELKNLSKEEKVKRLKELRKKYPTRTSVDIYDYDDDILDVELVVLYLLLLDEEVMSEFDESVDEMMELTFEEVEPEAVEAESAVAVEEITSDSSDFGSSDTDSGSSSDYGSSDFDSGGGDF
ncbi:MAG: hypothetical protein ACTSSP_02845 [Candidatus Asgardarchaeia archaeon]